MSQIQALRILLVDTLEKEITLCDLANRHGYEQDDVRRLASKFPDKLTIIAAEVLQHLISKLGAEVEVVIDIQAHLPDGADDQTLRVVTENCRTLRFDPTSGFEP